VKKSTGQYQALLATVRPRDRAGKTCRRMTAEELEDLHRLDATLQAMKAELKAAVLATGSRLMDIHGIGPAARSPGERANAQLKTWRILRKLRWARCQRTGSPAQAPAGRYPSPQRRATAPATIHARQVSPSDVPPQIRVSASRTIDHLP
jgi:hypothetical protein